MKKTDKSCETAISKATPMPRARLSEEGGLEAMLNEVSNAAADFILKYEHAKVFGEQLDGGLDSILRPIIEKHVTAARLAEAAAATKRDLSWVEDALKTANQYTIEGRKGARAVLLELQQSLRAGTSEGRGAA